MTELKCDSTSYDTDVSGYIFRFVAILRSVALKEAPTVRRGVVEVALLDRPRKLLQFLSCSVRLHKYWAWSGSTVHMAVQLYFTVCFIHFP